MWIVFLKIHNYRGLYSAKYINIADLIKNNLYLHKKR